MDLRDDSKMVRIVRDDGMKAVTHYKPLVTQKILHCLNCGLKPAEHIKFGVIWLI